MVKSPPANEGDAGDTGSIPGSGRSPGKGNGNPLQYSHQEDPRGRGAWQATVQGVTKTWTQFSDRASNIYKIDSQQGPTVKQRNYTQYLIILYDGKESEIHIYIYIYICKSLCYTPEINTTL